jgi:hypothetical protein
VTDGTATSNNVTATFRVDKLAPTLQLHNSSSSIYYDIPRATITASDTLSGLSAIYYRWNDNTHITIDNCGGTGTTTITTGTPGFSLGQTTPFTSSLIDTPTAGVNTLYACVTDRAGNTSVSSAPYLFGDALELQVTTTTADGTDGVTLSGTARGSQTDHTLQVWADVCNTTGTCVRRSQDLNSGNPISDQNWSLSWEITDLPAGEYDGTIWITLAEGTATVAIQTTPVHFNIEKRQLKLTVIKGQPFDIELGDTEVLKMIGLTPGVDPTTNLTLTDINGTLHASGTITTTTTTSSWETNLELVAKQLPGLEVANVSFR